MTPEERAELAREEARIAERFTALEAERDRLREQLAAFVPPGALGAGETPALCGTCKDRLCVPGLPGCARCVKAELAETTHALTVTGEKVTALRKQRDQAEAERDAAREQVKRVRAVHAPHDCNDSECPQRGNCDACDEPIPCTTERALDGTEATAEPTDTETRVFAAFADADIEGLDLNAMTVAELTALVMAGIRTEPGQ